MIAINTFFAVVMFYLAKYDFENDRNSLGWMNLMISAYNTAVVTNYFL